MADGIRPYGPGKFSTIVDSYIYQVAMDGCDEQCGDVQHGSWYGLMERVKVSPEMEAQLGEVLTPEEAALINDCVGVIIEEDSQGFVSVTYYENEAEMSEMWSQLEAATSEYGEEEED